MTKYGAIQIWGNNLSMNIEYKDPDLCGMECINAYYDVIFKAKDIDDFNLKKYTYKGSKLVSVRGIKFKIIERISRRRYLCEQTSHKDISHIPFFSAREKGIQYVFYDFNFDI